MVFVHNQGYMISFRLPFILHLPAWIATVGCSNSPHNYLTQGGNCNSFTFPFVFYIRYGHSLLEMDGTNLTCLGNF
ncbi:hypothetical protein XELAEV_18041558mg [Xenopus laevis]|uniref:Uncharacterized protein n=1 Tax=Xenopus laevis TaxID=8355 RepID=A0A974C2F4_XENLA|nr:hypothetical protein XELAEV_18041558mg [Xenopus laevis]